MIRFWHALLGNWRHTDPFTLKSVVDPASAGMTSERAGKMRRYAARSLSYPFRIRRNFSGSVAHVLDQSWADMLASVPTVAVKVATVHDLIPLRFSGELTRPQVARYHSWVRCLHLADLLMADSAHTKQEMQTLLGLSEEKIRVVPLGVDLPSAEPSIPTNIGERLEQRKASGNPLMIGSIGNGLQRKNLKILPPVLAELTARLKREVILVRVGQTMDTGLADEIRRGTGAHGLMELGNLTDKELADVYRKVDMVVFPSLYEGFGLPVLESMAYGTPVVCSSATSLPEVGGDAVLYFDPEDGAGLVRQLALMADPGVASRYGELGRGRAGLFTWRHCLEAIYKVYREAIELKRRRN